MSGVEWVPGTAVPGTLIIGASLGFAGVLAIACALVLRGTAVAWGFWVLGAVALIVGFVMAPIGLRQTPGMVNAESLRDGYSISQADARALVKAGPGEEVPIVIGGDKARVSLQLSSDDERAFLVADGERVPALPR